MKSIKMGVIAIYLLFLGLEWVKAVAEEGVISTVTGVFGLVTVLISFVCLLICVSIPADKE